MYLVLGLNGLIRHADNDDEHNGQDSDDSNVTNGQESDNVYFIGIELGASMQSADNTQSSLLCFQLI
jgi:hypothetical protein